MNHIQAEDLKVGQTIFIAHPVYGVDEVVVKSLPYESVHSGITLFNYRKGEDIGYKSVKDSGLNKDSYNYRRTFLNKEEADSYCEVIKKDKGFIENQLRHEVWVESMKDWHDDWYGDWD